MLYIFKMNKKDGEAHKSTMVKKNIFIGNISNVADWKIMMFQSTLDILIFYKTQPSSWYLGTNRKKIIQISNRNS